MSEARRARTGDRGPPEEATPMYTIAQIGPKRAMSAAGNLICYDVPIARTGQLLYRAGEVPIAPGQDGIIRVNRTAEQLFRPETMGSFMGVAVTNEHPPELEVTPKTWKQLAYGFSTTNVRRGEGDDSEVLLADLIITDKSLIDLILSGEKVEVSAGYDAEYVQTSVGEGDQVDIIGNHIALVTRGRCGPRCAIGDHDPFTKGKHMTIRKRLNTEQTLRRARAIVGDMEALLEESADPAAVGNDPQDETGGTHIHIHAGGGGGPSPAGGEPGAMPATLTTDNPGEGAPGGGDIEARMSALEKSVAMILAHIKGAAPPAAPAADEATDPVDPDAPPVEDPAKTGDEFPLDDDADDSSKTKTGDSAALARSYEKLLGDAEILVPGFRAPTFDSASNRTKTIDRMCSIRRRVLHSYAATADGAAVLDTNADPAKLDDMSCASVATVFATAAAAQRVINNRKATGDASRVPAEPEKPAQLSMADINRMNAEYWAKQGIPAH